MAKVIAVANQKGGTAKTTSAVNISACLGSKGIRTLLVDMDAQANASLSFVDINELEQTIYDCLLNNVLIQNIISKTGIDNVELAPSDISLAKLEAMLLGSVEGFYRLREVLKPVRNSYNYIIIDTPPSLGILTSNALIAATDVIIPIQSGYFALRGTEDLIETIENVRKVANPSLNILGTFLTIHDKRTILARDVLEDVRRIFGDKAFNTVIHKSVRLEESPAYGESILTYAPRSSGAIEYMELTEEILSRA